MTASTTGTAGTESTERNPALAWALTTLGGALFLLGVVRLVGAFAADYSPHFGGFPFGSPPPDPTPPLLCLKLAGFFATTGWLLERYQAWRTPLHRTVGTVGAAVRQFRRHLDQAIPEDGVLELLIGGVLFIVVVLAGLVSLWSQTIR